MAGALVGLDDSDSVGDCETLPSWIDGLAVGTTYGEISYAVVKSIFSTGERNSSRKSSPSF